MNSQDIISRLESKGIRPTANRILVMKTLMGEQNPQSLSNLERKMVSMDKSSIFRTLTLFLEHDVYMPSKMGEAYSATNSAKEKGACDHHDGTFISTANLASVPSVWRISIFQVSSCPKAFTPTLFPLSSKANARIAERNTSKAKGTFCVNLA